MNLPALLKFNIRYYRRHVLLSLLCLTGISLGVGIAVAVQLINGSALASFASSVDLLSGKATHSIVSVYGDLEERLFADVWKHPAVKAASPVVEVMATTVETGHEPIRFLGLDPFLDAPFRNLAPRRQEQEAFIGFLTGVIPSAYLSKDLMEQHKFRSGATITVLTAGIQNKVKILGTIPSAERFGFGENLAIVDIAAAQELFGRIGYLDRIDIILSGDAKGLSDVLSSSLKLTDRSERKATLKSILESFQLNLTGMSLMALFVGIFLIYNFSMFSVLSRREDMSLLLTLGSGRKDLVTAFLGESVLFGTVGSMVGIGFGYLVAWLSMEKVSSTITELYFYVGTDKIHLTPLIVLTGLGVGFLATFIGTALPALEIALTPPVLGMKRRTIEDRAHGVKGLLLLIGFVCLLIALITFWASRFSIFWGWSSALFTTLAFAFSTPSIISPLTARVGIVFKETLKSLTAFMAARMIGASLSRTSIAVAALAVALSVTMGVDNMIFSFRESVRDWLEGALEGDLYISPATTKWGHPLPDALIQQLRTDPNIEAVERYSAHAVELQGKPARLRVIDGDVLKDRSRFIFLKGKDGAWDRLISGGVFISESLAVRSGLDLGHSVVLQTPAGERAFPVAAVARDYSSDQGTVQIHRALYERIWQDGRVQSVALFLRPGVSLEEVRRYIVERFPGLDQTIVSNSRMKEDILVIFDKTFAPTATLKGVSLLVALLGVATALMAVLIERSRDMTLLGYLGLTPKEMGRINVYQAVLMGAAAFLISVLCGLVLTLVIVHAINYRSFGWSIDIHINYWILVRIFLLTILACLAAAIYPTYKLITSQTGRSLQEE